MNSLERVKAVFEGRLPDRVPMADAFWKETMPAWRRQGLPAGVHPAEYFGLDIRYAYFLDTSPRFNDEVIERADDYRIRRDSYGRTIKEMKAGDAPPHPTSWALRDEKDWEAIAPRLSACGVEGEVRWRRSIDRGGSGVFSAGSYLPGRR